MNNSILISAGEASGEHYGAGLINALRNLAPTTDFKFFGMGGDEMRAAGCETVIDTKDVAVVGLSEVIKHLPRIYGQFHRLVREAEERKPAAAVLVDFPDFNFRLAKELHRRGIPVIYFVSPQLWAWRKSRIKLVQKYVTKMLVIFPFEENYYRSRGVQAEFVGHPMADAHRPSLDRTSYAATNGINPDKVWIALLPGSRKQEIERNLGTMLDSAKLLGTDYEFILPVASTLSTEWIRAQTVSQPSGIAVRLVDDAKSALALSRAAIVASGTATVEAAIIGNPFVVVYRVAPLTWSLGRRMVNLDHFAMPNLIAGKTVVPELIQNKFTAENVVAEMRKIISNGPERTKMVSELAEVVKNLKPFAIPACERAAQVVLQVLSQ